MGQVISDKQILASAKERSLYRPYHIEVAGCRRKEEYLSPGHPLYRSLCDVFSVRNEGEEERMFPIFPTGCVSLLFYEKGETHQSWLCGACDEIRKLLIRPGEEYLLLRFLPGSCSAFLNCEAAELTNRSFDAAEKIRNGRRLQQIAEREIDTGMKALLASRVLRVEYKERESDYLIHFCREEILRHGGNISIRELAGKSGFSERYIGKLFEHYVGLSPKVYAEIVRFQTTLPQVMERDERGEWRPLVEVAVENGYFDHAHMNRAYRRFAHCSAGALRKKGAAALGLDSLPLMY